MQKILLFGLFMSFPVFGMDSDTGEELVEQNGQVVQVAQDLECAICWENKAGDHFWKLPNCDHSFCVPCVVKSAQFNNTACALCRKPWVLGGVRNEFAVPVPDAERANLKIALGIAATILFGGGYASYRLGMFPTFCSILLGLWMGYSDLRRR